MEVLEGSQIERPSLQRIGQTSNRGTINNSEMGKKKNIMDRKMNRLTIRKLTIKSISKVSFKNLISCL